MAVYEQWCSCREHSWLRDVCCVCSHDTLQVTRGKRTKQKRAQLKYADQDDEDRQIALELLGHIKPAPPTEADTGNAAGKQIFETYIKRVRIKRVRCVRERLSLTYI